MKEIEIPFGAKDSELKGWEYTIPEGMEAEIKDGKIVVREKESEDERIRKEIRDFLIDMECVKEWVAYLEKQKEQKPTKRPKFKIGDVVKFKGFGDEPANDTPLKIVGYDNELYLFDNGTTDLFSEQNLYELVEQKPAEWSEEDEAAYDAFMCEVVNEKMNPTIEQIKWLRSIRDRLKSLRPSWKPSEGQMEALEYVIRDYREDSCNATANYLQEILDHLENM